MYIEREALIELITAKFNAHYENACYQFIHDFFRCVIKLISKAPTADVAPIVHADVKVEIKTFKFRPNEVWVHAYCGECGRSLWCNKYDKEEWDAYKKDHYKVEYSNYCPDCGAKLRKN